MIAGRFLNSNFFAGIAARMDMVEDVLTFFYNTCFIGVCRKTHSYPLPSISVEDVVVDELVKFYPQTNSRSSYELNLQRCMGKYVNRK